MKSCIIRKLIRDYNKKITAIVALYVEGENIVGVSVDGDLIGRTIPLATILEEGGIINWETIPNWERVLKE